MIPTFNRPDLARQAALQMLAQTQPPDLICIHQNGSPESYAWAVEDLDSSRIIWLHSPETLPPHQWYSRPLRRLIDAGCSHFFWIDHDDIYLRQHVERSLADLEGVDFTISNACGILYLDGKQFRHQPEVEFNAHAPGGMSSSMCFNRSFALALADDLDSDTIHHYSDQVVARVTMPKFRCKVTQGRSSVYVAHANTVSSSHWVDTVAPPSRAPGGELLSMFKEGTGGRCHKWLHYFEIYERYLVQFRSMSPRCLEIGVERGGSLDLMAKYLGPGTKMVGIDIDPACSGHASSGHQIFIGDQANAGFLLDVNARSGPFDIIIDDGGHTPDQQIASFYTLFPLLANGGVYIVEDLHANLWASHQRSRFGITFLDLAKAMADKMTYRHLSPASFTAFSVDDDQSSDHLAEDNFAIGEIFGIHFYDSMVVFEKRAYERPRRERR